LGLGGVDVAAAIQAGKLADGLQARQVSVDAEIHEAVGERGIGTDLHPTAVVRTVGECHEEHASIDRSRSNGALDGELHPAIAKAPELTERRERIAQAAMLPAAAAAGHGRGYLRIEADTAGRDKVPNGGGG